MLRPRTWRHSSKKHLNVDMQEDDIDARGMGLETYSVCATSPCRLQRAHEVELHLSDRQSGTCSPSRRRPSPYSVCRPRGKAQRLSLFGRKHERIIRTILCPKIEKARLTRTKGAWLQTRGSNKSPHSNEKKAHQSGGPSSAHSAETKTTPPRTRFWHCKGDHWLRDIPTATEADKAAAIEVIKSMQDSSRAKKVTPVLAVGEIIVNSLLSLPYCADSGATS
ncbi:hypothetical protein GQ600_25224 [Phytophthora cactorum]|nr:hypothetical protein GQ600_25224 [Phytophthora cactorum]